MCLLSIYQLYTYKEVEYIGFDSRDSSAVLSYLEFILLHQGCFRKHTSMNTLLNRQSFLNADDKQGGPLFVVIVIPVRAF